MEDRTDRLLDVWLESALLVDGVMGGVIAVVGFTTFAVVSGYVTLDIVAILIYALLTFVVVSIIFIIQYWFARVNAASINKKLNEIRN